MRLRFHALLALTVVVAAPALLLAQEPAAAAAPLTAEAYIEHVKYLASDELEGRMTGSPGNAKAAEYIRECFQAAGCEPGGPDSEWFQPFDVRQGKRLVDENALLEISGSDHEWKVRQDWIPFPFSEYGDVEGPLAFAGYGIQAEKYGFDDYAGFDAEGKVLLIFRYEPKAEDPAADFGGEIPSRHSLFVRKARVAYKQGAKALLVVNPPGRDPENDELYPFDTFNSVQTYQVPMVHIKRAVAEAILKQAGMPDLKVLETQLDTERKSLSKDLGLTINLRTGIAPHIIPAKNVLGLLPGDGSTEETIVIGAHYDHVGVVPRQFQRDDQTPMIHNGADDNASGTAAIIELARALADGQKLHRNLLFIAFDGEEMGLLGSQHFVQQPTVPLEDIPVMVNFDMIGRLSQGKYTVFSTHSGQGLPELVREYAEQFDLKYKAGGSMDGSDHASFLRQHIPALFVFTGMHDQYHQPEDDWELIDAEGAAQVLHMWQPIITELANMQVGPAYTDPATQPSEDAEAPKPAVEENREHAERDAAEEGNSHSKTTPSPTGVSVRLGIIPDRSGDDTPGIVVEIVLDGGAAQAAGMQPGDRITRIGDHQIRDIYAYLQAMRSFEPGNEVDVIVARNGETIALRVKLRAPN